MIESGYSLATAAAALAVLELAGAVGALTAGTISDRFGRRNVLLVVMLCSPALMYLFCISSGIASWLLLVVIGLLFFSSTPVFMAIIHDLDSDRPTLANGIFMTINFVAGSVIALLLGLFADRFGLPFAYKLSAFLCLPAILPALLMKDRRKSQ